MWRFSLPLRAIPFCFYDTASLRKQGFDTLEVRFHVVLVSFFPSLFAFEPLIRRTLKWCLQSFHSGHISLSMLSGTLKTHAPSFESSLGLCHFGEGSAELQSLELNTGFWLCEVTECNCDLTSQWDPSPGCGKIPLPRGCPYNNLLVPNPKRINWMAKNSSNNPSKYILLLQENKGNCCKLP